MLENKLEEMKTAVPVNAPAAAPANAAPPARVYAAPPCCINGSCLDMSRYDLEQTGI
jgi:hypothetical protein